MNIRKTALAPFIRRAAESIVDWTERSSPVIGIGHTTYGTGKVARVSGDELAARTDADGRIAPYAPDDPAVLRKLFRLEID